MIELKIKSRNLKYDLLSLENNPPLLKILFKHTYSEKTFSITNPNKQIEIIIIIFKLPNKSLYTL